MRGKEHAMHSTRTIATVMLLAGSAFGVLGPASPVPEARAKTPADIAINGTYQADSIGGWAKINQQYNSEREITSTWKISTTCTTMEDCTGTVTSDQGWTAPITCRTGNGAQMAPPTRENRRTGSIRRM
jgi:hypothetical protein